LPPKTAEEILARERERKERTTLLMALPEDHLAKFHKMTDAKDMRNAIKSKFGGNDKSKKMQKYILKQQFEGFSVSNSEGLHKGYDRVFKSDIKGSTGSSSSAQNVAFVSSEITNSTNDVSTSYGVSTSSGYNLQRENSSTYTKELMYSFFVNQPSGLHLDHEDLEQLDEFDLEEMDLKWKVAMIFMRLKKFYKKTERKLHSDAKEPVGFDKTKVECYNCHKTWNFARECGSKGKTGYKSKDNGKRPGKQEEPKALVTLNGEETIARSFERKVELKTKLRISISSKGLSKLLNSQMSTRDKSGLGLSDVEDSPVHDRFANVEGMHAVPPPMTGNYIPPGPDREVDDSMFTYGPKQSKTSESDTQTSNFDSCESNSSVETLEYVLKPVVVKPKVVSQLKVWSDAPIIEEYESDSDDEYVIQPSKEQEKPSFAFVNTVKHVKTPRETVKEQNTYSPSPKADKRDWNGLMSKRLGLGYGFTKKACFVCGSFSHLIRDCDFHEKRMAKQVELNKKKGKGTGQGENRLVWNNVQRLNHQNKFVSKADNPQRVLKNKRIVDSGCSRHMTELQHFNLFSVSQMCDKKNKVLFTDSECLVLSPEFKLPDENQVLLKIPRQNNMYSFNLENIVPLGGLACLIVKATSDESNKWHRRLGHVNFKNLNKLVKGNLVRGLPSKIFQNDHTCVACQKGKQHKASCKAKIVSSISQPLQLLHMDLFGPTSVRSINHKTYCLVITDDFSRFSWVFFLRTKDETSGILKDFIRQIENQLNQKVKTIRCDNGTEFKNRDIIELCGSKGIKREYSNARTPQQNGVAKRKNMTLIEAARTMLADSFLPNTFWAEAVSTACYVLNRVLVTKPQNKTPYELITGKIPIISYIRPFGCHVTILNTIDHLGKFKGKSDEWFLVGKGPNWLFDLDYLTDSMNYQPVRSDNQANKIAGPKEANHSAGTQDNIDAGNSKMEADPAQDYFVLPIYSSYTLTDKSAEEKNEGVKHTKDIGLNTNEAPVDQEDQAFLEEFERLKRQEKETNDAAEVLRKEFAQSTEDLLLQVGASRATSTNTVNTISIPLSTANPLNVFSTGGPSYPNLTNYADQDDSQIPALEDIYGNSNDGIFTNASYDDEGAVADFTNLESTVNVSPIPTSRIHSIHPTTQILGDPKLAVQTRSKVNKSSGAHAFISYIQKQRRNNHKDFQHCLFACFLSQIEPKKISEALEDESWVDAMQEELLQFKIQKVWILVDLPYGKKAIRTKWVYRNKHNERGVVVRNKARLVTQGHRQEEGIDYDEVFAIVARIEAIRIFLAFASYMGYIVYQMDVKSAFLYGTIDEEVYVSQPLGFVDPKFPKKVYKVVKALYGLHQAPRAWYATLSTFLLKSRYRRGTNDNTLFIKKDKNDIMLVQVYVDDIIFGSTKRSWCDEFEALMKSRFQMSSMGELTFFLGLQVKQKEDGIFISQDKYVAEILKKFDFASVKTASTPIETQKPLVKDEEATDVDVHLYRSMIGSLMYLTASRPDIMFAVCACSRFQVTPKTSHLNVVKRIFRYLKGKPKLGLWYPRVSSFDLEAYSDSDYAGANLDRKSTTGGCQFLGRRLISWQCKKQTIVATSTTKAEYVAAANCCGQVLWIQNQMLDYGFNFMNTKIYIDNESTICIVKNLVFHSKTKHIEIRHHFIRDAYEKKLIQVLKIHTDDNVADLLTKAFDVSRFNFLIVNIGMINQYAALVKGRQDDLLYNLYEVFCEQKNLDNGDVFHRVIWVLESNWRELSMTSAKSRTVNNISYRDAIFAGKPVTISEASIRSDLLFNDANGIDTLNN
ncbi:putative ribonuclease H-like domain-containing protein, partial [Tanacetum coccineum]